MLMDKAKLIRTAYHIAVPLALVMSATALVITWPLFHPIRPTVWSEEPEVDKVNSWMQEFLDKADANESYQWHLDIDVLARLNRYHHAGVMLYEAVEGADHILIQWPAKGRGTWDATPGIPVFKAKVRSRCPLACDFQGVSSTHWPTSPQTPDVTAVNTADAVTYINNYKPGTSGNFHLSAIYLSDGAISKMLSLKIPNGGVRISLAVRGFFNTLIAVAAPTDDAGFADFGQSMVSTGKDVGTDNQFQRP